MKALVTGGAGFIGSHLSERLLAQGAEVVAIDCFTDYYPRADQGAEPRRACAASPAIASSRAIWRRRTSPTLLDGVTHVFHLAAQAGVRKSWGRDFRDLHDAQRRRDADAARGLRRPPDRARRLRLELVGLRRRGGAADARGRGAAAGVALRRDQAGGRAPVPPVFRQPRRADRVAALLHGLRARGSGPTWGSTASSRAVLEGRPRGPVRRRPADPRLHVRRRRGRRPRPRRPSGEPREASTISVEGSRVIAAGGLRADWPGVRPAGADRPSSPRRRATCATPTRTRRGPAPISGLPRRSPWSRGCARCSPGWKRFANDETRSMCSCWPSAPGRAGLRRPARSPIPPGTAEADKFLFTRGEEEFKERNWLRGARVLPPDRRQLPAEPVPARRQARPSATRYIGEDTTESLLLAVNEFREFLTFYPTNPRADYAQYRLAFAYSQQMLAADRDQIGDPRRHQGTAGLPRSLSEQPADARGAQADARGQGSPERGELPRRVHLLPHEVVRRARSIASGKCSRRTRSTRIATAVYFYLAESLRRDRHRMRKPEALPYYERLLKEFEQSEHLEEAKKRISELKAELKTPF